MCKYFFEDIGDFIQDKVIDPIKGVFKPDMSGVEAAAKAQSDALQTSLAQQNEIANKSLELQKQALDKAERAAVPAFDNESTRLAAESKMRRLIAGGSGARMGSRYLGEAPTGYRLLTGQ